MARGLTIWVEVVDGGISGQAPVIHCRQALVNPREVELVAAWAKAKLRAYPKPTTVPKRTVEFVTDAGLWKVEQGMRVFQGLWWMWSTSRQIGALVGDNTPSEQLMELAEQLTERHQRILDLTKEQP